MTRRTKIIVVVSVNRSQLLVFPRVQTCMWAFSTTTSRRLHCRGRREVDAVKWKSWTREDRHVEVENTKSPNREVMQVDEAARIDEVASEGQGFAR